jgi:2-(1,2-epoxy-1,2-dihydrophenyl)acetyl-CoA isomerase
MMHRLQTGATLKKRKDPMAGNFETIHVTDDSGVRTITLNRPDVLNSFNTQMLKELGKAVRDAAKDKTVRCLVLTGSGRGFCAGQDLADVADRYKSDDPIELGHHIRKHYNPLIASLRTMEKPVIASVNGAAAGAGCSLALAADIRIASESASFIQAFIHVGLVPDSGSTFFLPQLIGTARAFEMTCTGRKVKADEALQIGLVNQVVPAVQLSEATAKLARKLAALPSRGIALTKRALNAAATNDLVSQLDYEAQLQTTAGKTKDHREGVAAFIEKRPPNFTGE